MDVASVVKFQDFRWARPVGTNLKQAKSPMGLMFLDLRTIEWQR